MRHVLLFFAAANLTFFTIALWDEKFLWALLHALIFVLCMVDAESRRKKRTL